MDHTVEVKKIGSPEKGMYIVVLDGDIELQPECTAYEAEIIVKWLRGGALHEIEEIL